MDFSPDKLRKRFHLLTGERGKIDAKLDPLRAELNKIVAGDVNMTIKQARTREEKVREQIKKLQAGLSPIEMERATLARALGGKTGVPD
jgi:chaperonin cofactor prefoldin